MRLYRIEEKRQRDNFTKIKEKGEIINSTVYLTHRYSLIRRPRSPQAVIYSLRERVRHLPHGQGKAIREAVLRLFSLYGNPR